MQWKELCDNVAFSYIAKDKRILIKSIYLIRDQVQDYTQNKPIRMNHYKSHWKDLCVNLNKQVERKNKKAIKKTVLAIVDAIKIYRETAAQDERYKNGWAKRGKRNE
jgi:hypothetical protein